MAEIAEILQRVTETPRPNFTAIAKKEAEEVVSKILLILIYTFISASPNELCNYENNCSSQEV